MSPDALARWARDPRDPTGRAPRTLGELLRAVREDRGLSLRQVARALRWSTGFVRFVEGESDVTLRAEPCRQILAAVAASPEHVAEARRLGWRE